MEEKKSTTEISPAEKKTELIKVANKMKWIIFIGMFVGIASAIIQINPFAGAIALIIGVFLLIFWAFYIVVTDERIRKICEKAFTSAIVIFAAIVGIACLVVVLMEPLQLTFITQVSPIFYPLTYALFIIITLFIVCCFYYQRKM